MTTTDAVRRILFMGNTPFRRTANRKKGPALPPDAGRLGSRIVAQRRAPRATITTDEHDRRCRIPPG
jgi:hypothetical protein